MKQRPIIFNTEMVQAILDGRKTQTRRPVNPALVQSERLPLETSKGIFKFWCSDEVSSPFGSVGDQLWVRETWRRFNSSDECGCSESPCSCPSNGTVLFKASHDDGESKWKPSIHMPRWAARIILEITDVRVERLSDISEQDAKAEGFDYPAVPDMGWWKFNARHNFLVEWDLIYGNRSSNPWVWVIEFKVISTSGGEA
ncbi:hypothetical protein ACE02Z_06025 [Shewanella xiamenensis]|uniref:hypothetical protein n=1 Tax=Shewanella xiamenensis TaxID=332186 RepID=UPI00313E2442